jgi:hypothetical protein
MITSLLTHCVGCGRKLRDALFCRGCGQGACSWECLTRHRAWHAGAARDGLDGPSPASASTPGRFVEAVRAASA